jgi:hypothetical protein
VTQSGGVHEIHIGERFDLHRLLRHPRFCAAGRANAYPCGNNINGMAPTEDREARHRRRAGAQILREIYVTTPEQHLRFDSAVASRDGDICFFMQASDARQSPELVYAFFDHEEERVRYGLEWRDIVTQCDGPGSRDLTAFVEDSFAL